PVPARFCLYACPCCPAALVSPAASLHLAFYLSRYADPRPLHSFPPRRSSDLRRVLDRLRRVRVRAGDRGPTRSAPGPYPRHVPQDRKSTRLNSSHVKSSYAVFCLKKKNRSNRGREPAHRHSSSLAHGDRGRVE